MIDPLASQPVSLLSLALSLWRHREFISQMTRRELTGRYHFSMLKQ